MRRLALKRLTRSDLTLFQWQFENANAGNQKAINLNADVFIKALYPGLPRLAEDSGGRIPIDLYLYGPGVRREMNLQRKIIKSGSSYKNWRLNGEFIVNPPDDLTRFDGLVAGDFAVLEFSGEQVPTAARAVFVSAEEDPALHAACAKAVGDASMVALSPTDLEEIVDGSGVASDHPVGNLTLEDALEDAAQGGSEGIRELKRRAPSRRISRVDLLNARKQADHIGQWGEEFVNGRLEAEAAAGRINSLRWVSHRENAAASHDFAFTDADGTDVRLDVKSTSGGFERIIHVSGAELEDMATFEGRYDLYRVYGLEDGGAELRIAEGVSDKAKGLIESCSALPGWARVDSLSVRPEAFPFGGSMRLEPSEDTE